MDSVALSSVSVCVTFAQKPGAFVLAPDICTSCSFEVRSVKLFAKRPIEELGGCRVRMTAQSMTSVTLLRILLEERYGLRPDYLNGSYEDSDEACLLIGDQALEENERCRFSFDYDLGSLWLEWQKLPFVFGAWIISRSALRPGLEQTLANYMDATKRSIECFKANSKQALDKWLSKYPVCLPRPVIDDYYTALDYRFTDERKESLKLFFKYAQKMNLVQEVPMLEFL